MSNVIWTNLEKLFNYTHTIVMGVGCWRLAFWSLELMACCFFSVVIVVVRCWFEWLAGWINEFRGLYSKSNETQTRTHANTRTNKLYHKSCSTECAERSFCSSLFLVLFLSIFFSWALWTITFVRLFVPSMNEFGCEANHCIGWSLCWIGANPWIVLNNDNDKNNNDDDEQEKNDTREKKVYHYLYYRANM